jgi:hypothetical protein
MGRDSPRVTPLRKKRRWFGLAVWCLYCVLVFEIGSQLYCYFFTDLQPFASDVSTLAFYPELEGIPEKIGGDAIYDVLLLGGSVLWEWAELPETLQRLAQITIDGKPVRMHLAALPAHTSLDSLYKLRYLADQPFDLYVLYQGINEVRTNNIPPRYWRMDYSHYSWYAEANFLQRNATVIDAGLRSPVVLFRLKQLLVASLGIRKFVPTDWADDEFLKYGSDVRSAEPFRRNVERMLDIAARNGTPFLLSTFAWHRPENYDMEDYRRPEPAAEEGVYRDFFILPIELWGRPDDVVRALALHNEVLRSMRGHPAVLDVVPMDDRIPKDATFFEDICHFTEQGYAEFGENLIAAMASAGTE